MPILIFNYGLVAAFAFDEGISDPRCPAKDPSNNPVHLPHSQTCHKFFKCFGGKAFELSCPPGQEYAVTLNRCDFPQFAECSIPPGRGIRVVKASSEESEEYSDSDDYSRELSSDEKEMIQGVIDDRCPAEDTPGFVVHLPHTKDCNKFYKCANGRAFMIQCPKGQHWAVRVNRCDYPKVAKCKV